MARLLQGPINWTGFMWGLGIVLVLIYIVTTFFNFGTNTFQAPEGTKWIINSFTIIFLIILAVVGMNVAKTFGEEINKKKVFTIILLVIVGYFVWTILAPIIGAPSIDSISFDVAKKTGLSTIILP